METKIKGLNRDPPDISLLTQHNTNEDGLPGTYLKDFRICVTCKRWCQAINNLGTLQCKFHPMVSNTLKQYIDTACAAVLATIFFYIFSPPLFYIFVKN